MTAPGELSLRKCQQCGDRLRRRAKEGRQMFADRLFCSRACRDASRRMLDPRERCDHCGNVKQRRPKERSNRYKERRYCSSDCYLASRGAVRRAASERRKKAEPKPQQLPKGQFKSTSYHGPIHRAPGNKGVTDPTLPRWQTVRPGEMTEQLDTGTCTNEITVSGRQQACGERLNAFGVCGRCRNRAGWLAGQRAKAGANIGYQIMRMGSE